MASRNLIAVDAHKSSFTFVVFDAGEPVVGPSRRPNNEQTVRALVRQYPGRLVVVEACGVHEWMVDAWIEEGAEVFVCKPFKTEAREKSDGRDTLRLGRRFLSGELKRVHHFGPDLRLLRSLVRERAFLVTLRTQIVNHVRHELNRWNLSHFDMSKDRGDVLARLPHLSSNLHLLDTLEETIKPLDKKIKQIGPTIPAVRRLRTIPGFGDVVSLAFYAEIGDIKRFPTAESVVKYIGVDPVWKQSGDTLTDQHRISKAGNSRLRSLILQSAWVHVRTSPDTTISQKYRHLVQAGKAKPVAITAVERHLIEIAWSIWHDDRDFTIIRPAPSLA